MFDNSPYYMQYIYTLLIWKLAFWLAAVVYLIYLLRLRVKRIWLWIFCSAVIGTLVYSTQSVPPTMMLAKGHRVYVHNSRITAGILTWLTEQSPPDHALEVGNSKMWLVSLCDLPFYINTDMPAIVFEKNAQRWVRIVYRFNSANEFGLCVYLSDSVVPADESEIRLSVNENSFVWATKQKQPYKWITK